MKKINGTPMIGLLLKRIKHSEYIDEIVVASTTNKEDDQLIEQSIRKFSLVQGL